MSIGSFTIAMVAVFERKGLYMRAKRSGRDGFASASARDYVPHLDVGS
jgi:hypothetical protein